MISEGESAVSGVNCVKEGMQPPGRKKPLREIVAASRGPVRTSRITARGVDKHFVLIDQSHGVPWE